MKKEILIVDGYNVIYAWPILASICDDLAYARDKLIDILLEYGTDIKITVVFDSHLTSGRIQKDNVSSLLEVIFTNAGQTADSYIEKWYVTLLDKIGGFL